MDIRECIAIITEPGFTVEDKKTEEAFDLATQTLQDVADGKLIDEERRSGLLQEIHRTEVEEEAT